jgi:hypothetical protein
MGLVIRFERSCGFARTRGYPPTQGRIEESKMKRKQTPPSAPTSARPYRAYFRYALGAVFIGLVGFGIHMAGKHDPAETPPTTDATVTTGSADAKTWALDAVPEDVLALRLTQEAAQRLAQPPENHIPVRADDMPRPPLGALTALPPPPQSFASAMAPHQPPSQNPGGVNGSRPARPIPGF